MPDMASGDRSIAPLGYRKTTPGPRAQPCRMKNPEAGLGVRATASYGIVPSEKRLPRCSSQGTYLVIVMNTVVRLSRYPQPPGYLKVTRYLPGE